MAPNHCRFRFHYQINCSALLYSENVEDNKKYALFMIKTFDCPHLGCIEHPSWGITVKRVEGLQTFNDIQDDNEMLCKLEKWVKKLTESILPTISEIDFISTIFGRR